MRDRDEWMRRLGPLYPAAVALRRTTAVRWPPGLETAGDDLARSAPWMVALGAALGLCAWSGAWLIAQIGAAPALGAAVALALASVLAAAQLELGVARRADGVLAGAGPVAIALLVVVRVVALLAIAPGAWMGVLVAAPLVGRWGALLAQRLGDPIEPAGADRDLVVGAVSWTQVAVLTAAVAIAAILLVGWSSVLALIVAAGAVVGLGLDAQRRDGGLGRDVLAAAAAAGELAILVVAAAAHAAIRSPFALVS